MENCDEVELPVMTGDYTQQKRLSALRMQNPFLQIMPFPNQVLHCVVKNGVPVDVPLPPETKFVRFSGTADYFVSRNGNAKIPVSTDGQQDGNAVLYRPEYCWFLVDGITSISVVSGSVQDVIVTIHCFEQL